MVKYGRSIEFINREIDQIKQSNVKLSTIGDVLKRIEG